MSSDLKARSDHTAAFELEAQTGAQTGAETERTGIYWKPSLWALARSAYVADLDHDPGSPGAFVPWLGRALEKHAALTPAQRAAIAEEPRLQDLTGAGVSRSHPLRVRTIELVVEAVIADRQLGRVVSRSAFAAEAVVVAAQAARERLGRPLPPPPARLSNRPPRRRRGSATGGS